MTEREIIRAGGTVEGGGGRSTWLINTQLMWAIKEALGKDKREYLIAHGDGAITLKRRTGYNP